MSLQFRDREATFNSRAVPVFRDGMAMTAGAGVSINKTVSVSLNYIDMLSDNYQDNGLIVKLKWLL
ncbi:hypothetical protein DOH12_21650 [Salmonella enterica subsp. enterica]|nr:hypothetical protein [Salmonella enterica subsp. enterica serovar Sandiego]